MTNLNECDFKDLGPINPKNPHIHAFVYKPENYPGPIALNATIRKEKDDL